MPVVASTGYAQIRTGEHNRFLYSLLHTESFLNEVLLRCTGSNYPAINSNDLKEISIYIPEKKEQVKIAGFMLLLDERIAKQRRLIEALKSYKRGVFKRIYDTKIQDSPMLPLGELVICHDSKRVPVNSQDRSSRQGIYPYYGANGIQGYMDDYIFDGEFVLLAEDGGHFDEFLYRPIAQYVNEKCWVNNHAHILEVTKCNSKYLFYILEHMDIRSYINGTSRAKLNQEDMLTILIPCPNTETQVLFASVMSEVDDVTKKALAILEDLERYKGGLLQQLFI